MPSWRSSPRKSVLQITDAEETEVISCLWSFHVEILGSLPSGKTVLFAGVTADQFLDLHLKAPKTTSVGLETFRQDVKPTTSQTTPVSMESKT